MIQARTKVKAALVSELKSLAVAMPVKLIKKEIEEVQLVMWIDEDGYSCGGMVMEVDEKIVVQCLQQDDGVGKNWYPVWKKEDTMLRKMVQPEGYERLEEVIEFENVKLVGRLTDKWRMEDATCRKAIEINMM